MKTLVSETIPKFNTFFEMRLCSNDGGNGFFVGKEVCIISFFHCRSYSQFRKKVWTQISAQNVFCLGTCGMTVL